MMSFLQGAIDWIVPFLFVLTLVVTIHEMGHFYAARAFGIAIDRFAIGFGRPLLKWRDKYGTDWQIGWIPLGGYVRFSGDENAASVPDKNDLEVLKKRIIEVNGVEAVSHYFHFKPLWQRAIVVAAGPGGGPHVRTFLSNGQPAPGAAGDGFFAYGPQFDGGVSIAVGDVRADVPGDEIVTGAFSKGGPHVRIWTAEGQLLGEFFAFDPNFTGGVSVAVGDFDSATGEEIAVGAGPGAGPHVRLFKGDTTASLLGLGTLERPPESSGSGS